MVDTPTAAPSTTATTRPAPGGPGGRRGPQQGGGRRRRQKSRFGTQMEEKQTLKGIYGIREAQLKRYYVESLASAEETGPQMISLLERRLDNALFRSGFSETRKQARQMATHGIATVNGRAVDIPSLRLHPGDVVAIKESKRSKPFFENFQKRLQNVSTPSWLALDGEAFAFKVTGLPTAEEATIGVDIRAVVEYFSR